MIGLIALLVVLAGAWSATAPVRGRLAARFDVRREHYRILFYGLPVGWRSEYSRLLKERYGIETSTVASCIVSQSLVSYVDSYDRISTSAANKKFGHDIFEECAEAAKGSWERQQRLRAPKQSSP